MGFYEVFVTTISLLVYLPFLLLPKLRRNTFAYILIGERQPRISLKTIETLKEELNQALLE